MAFYKKVKRNITRNNQTEEKWYLTAVTQGKAVSTKEISQRLAAESTVSPADVNAVLTALPEIMKLYLSQGRNVRLDNLGTFSYRIINGEGADTREDATVNQIDTVRVQFTQELIYEKISGRRVARRSLVDSNLFWEEYDKPSRVKKTTASGSAPQGSTPGGGTTSGSGTNPDSGDEEP